MESLHIQIGLIAQNTIRIASIGNYYSRNDFLQDWFLKFEFLQSVSPKNIFYRCLKICETRIIEGQRDLIISICTRCTYNNYIVLEVKLEGSTEIAIRMQRSDVLIRCTSFA